VSKLTNFSILLHFVLSYNYSHPQIQFYHQNMNSYSQLYIVFLCHPKRPRPWVPLSYLGHRSTPQPIFFFGKLTFFMGRIRLGTACSNISHHEEPLLYIHSCLAGKSEKIFPEDSCRDLEDRRLNLEPCWWWWWWWW
jgi:hypothetical protein